jgi:hypothetical protein
LPLRCSALIRPDHQNNEPIPLGEALVECDHRWLSRRERGGIQVRIYARHCIRKASGVSWDVDHDEWVREQKVLPAFAELNS